MCDSVLDASTFMSQFWRAQLLDLIWFDSRLPYRRWPCESRRGKIRVEVESRRFPHFCFVFICEVRFLNYWYLFRHKIMYDHGRHHSIHSRITSIIRNDYNIDSDNVLLLYCTVLYCITLPRPLRDTILPPKFVTKGQVLTGYNASPVAWRFMRRERQTA